MKRRLQVGVVALILVAGCGSPRTMAPSASSATGTGSAAARTNFMDAGATSGCPSPECTDILNQVAQGAKTDIIPADLTPSVAASAKDLHFPDGGQCDKLPLPDIKDLWQPCFYPTGAKPDAPLIVVIGDSTAWMWSVAVTEMASQLGYRAAAVAHPGCHMPDAIFPNTAAGVTGEQCKAWKDAAVDWTSQQKPAVVLIGSLPGKVVSGDPYAQAYVTTIKRLEGPERKVFVMGDVPTLAQDPPRCLAANESSATRCATPTVAAAPTDPQQTALDASQQAGAGYVNVTPLACTADLCPAIIGKFVAYQDRYHFTSTYAEQLVPLLTRALSLTPVA